MPRAAPTRVLLMACAVAWSCAQAPSPATSLPPATPPPEAVPTPAPSPTPALADERPVLRVSLSPFPIGGVAPVTLVADLCRSFDPGGARLEYAFEWAGEGKSLSGQCRMTHTYREPIRSRAFFCVTDGNPRHLVCRNYAVEID